MADLLVNAGIGFGAGVVASVILFRREWLLKPADLSARTALM